MYTHTCLWDVSRDTHFCSTALLFILERAPAEYSMLVSSFMLFYPSNLDSIFKSRDITLPTKVRLVKAVFFPVVMYGCESCTVKKAEHWRIDAFEVWCWRRFLRVPWTARRSNQSILKEISPKYSLEGLMLKLKFQYFGHLMRRADSFEKTLMLFKKKEWRRKEKGMTEDEIGGWHHWLNGHEFDETLGVGDGQGGLVCFSPWGCKELDTSERLNWTESYRGLVCNELLLSRCFQDSLFVFVSENLFIFHLFFPP